MQSGVLTSISSRQRSAISGHTLPERRDVGPAVWS